jgi:hypothetical protein
MLRWSQDLPVRVVAFDSILRFSNIIRLPVVNLLHYAVDVEPKHYTRRNRQAVCVALEM